MRAHTFRNPPSEKRDGVHGVLLHDKNLQDVKAKEQILKSTILVKLRPTDPLQTIVAMLPEENSPCIVSLATLATVIFISRVSSPGKNTIVVLEVKYSSAFCAYSESVAQCHCVGRMNMRWQLV